MFGELLGGLIDKEEMTRKTIKNALEDVAEELGCSHKECFITIMPTDEKFNHKYFVCKYDESGNPKMVREITLKEILGETDK